VETCTSMSAIQLLATGFGFLLAVLWLDIVWVHSVSDQHDITAVLRRRGWLNAFVAFGAFGAAVLLLVWVNSCTHGAF
jgi:hypothetical protein